MKILIIENEYNSIIPTFTAVEKLLLGASLEKDHVDKSQDIPWDDLTSYHAIFVDISLATRSELDGFGIIEQIQQQYPELLPRVAIITGNDMISERLIERGLHGCQVEIFEKPLRYKEIGAFINRGSINHSN